MKPAASHGTTARSMSQHSQRLLMAYRASSLAVVLLGLGWGIAFALMGRWQLAIAEALLVVVGATSLVLLARGKVSTALLTTQTAFVLFAIAFCLLFDVPSATMPRVSHLYLLPLAAFGYINYLREPSPTQAVLIALCLAGFVLFSSARLQLPMAVPIADSIRVYGVWINALLATGLLCGCIMAMQREFSSNTRMVRELKSAIWNDELILHFQPQVDGNGRIHGAEALLRWMHPDRGCVPPMDFLPLAEQGGLMPRIGAWVLADACQTLAAWSRDEATRSLSLAINVSAEQFLMDGFEELVLGTLKSHGVDPSKLKLELTESTVISDIPMVARKMETLCKAGITLALDDFGTGYSSLSYLRSLPLQEIKIDRSFVSAALSSARGAALTRTITQMGQDLGLVVTAEGVETVAQLDFLSGCGCTEFQGYYFGRPVALAAFEEQVRQAVGRQESLPV